MDNQKMNNNRPDQDPEGGNNKKDDMNKKSLHDHGHSCNCSDDYCPDAVRQDCSPLPRRK